MISNPVSGRVVDGELGDGGGRKGLPCCHHYFRTLSASYTTIIPLLSDSTPLTQSPAHRIMTSSNKTTLSITVMTYVHFTQLTWSGHTRENQLTFYFSHCRSLTCNVYISPFWGLLMWPQGVAESGERCFPPSNIFSYLLFYYSSAASWTVEQLHNVSLTAFSGLDQSVISSCWRKIEKVAFSSSF